MFGYYPQFKLCVSVCCAPSCPWPWGMKEYNAMVLPPLAWRLKSSKSHLYEIEL